MKNIPKEKPPTPSQLMLMKNHKEKEDVAKLFVSKIDPRKEIVDHYSTLIWRMNSLEKIKACLGNLYEKAYSNGLSDMDKMHSI